MENSDGAIYLNNISTPIVKSNEKKVRLGLSQSPSAISLHENAPPIGSRKQSKESLARGTTGTRGS